MEHALPPNSITVDALINEFRQTVQSLPARYARRLRTVYERLEHWLHLRDQVGRVAETTITDLQLENACLRFDLDMTKRELQQRKAEEDG
jgi:hypothetical protein